MAKKSACVILTMSEMRETFRKDRRKEPNVMNIVTEGKDGEQIQATDKLKNSNKLSRDICREGGSKILMASFDLMSWREGSGGKRETKMRSVKETFLGDGIEKAHTSVGGEDLVRDIVK
jgi:hypothetical protein